MSLKLLIDTYGKNFPNNKNGESLIKRAYDFASLAHQKQKRANGDNYLIHAYETALQLTLWRLDAESIASGLLHDTIEDCNVKPKTIEKEFGPSIRFIVEGVTKLGTLKYSDVEKRGAESLRKMMLSISKDLRVVFVKLSDRLHNMKTLKHVAKEKQLRIAVETMEIYAPLALRLGMQNISNELQELAFPHIHPEAYKWLEKEVKEPFETRNKYLKKVEPIVKKRLTAENIKPIRIDYRAKRLYSLYSKLKRYDMNLGQIYDLVALRIIVKDVSECYKTLGLIHQIWPPMPGRIKDYIALPKPNGYQSLHTTVFSLEGKPAEFQIRTLEMHEQSENGAAAHWFYESNKSSNNPEKRNRKATQQEIEWVQQLKGWQNQFPGSKEFIEALKIDIFSDRIFVLSPKGRVFDLPIGSTPIDFAYKIHTTIGNSCVGSKINNKMVPIDTQLQSGDVVDILTQKSKRPSESWIRFAKTSGAKKKIRSNLNQKKISNRRFEYQIGGKGNIGLIKDISSVFLRNHISIEKIEVSQSQMPIIRIIATIKTKEKAEEVSLKIKKIKNIEQVGLKEIKKR